MSTYKITGLPFPGFARVSRPSRYIGGEVGEVRKDPASVKCRIALAFPDIYEIGMSHLGYQILYHGFNSDGRVYAERVFAPWFDAENEIRGAGRKLSTLETGTPLSDFDAIGFTLSHELAATNVLYMLDLGGIPLLARERSDGDPIVIAGGCVAVNPEPLADFLDAVYLGDAEPAFSELADVLIKGKENRWERRRTLEALANIEGVYVPSLFEPRFENGRYIGTFPVRPDILTPRRRIAADLDKYPLPEKPVVPFADAVHNRVAAEVARGCGRGCRFCEAGMYYRPVRERSPESVVGYACAALDGTGHEDMSLMALTTGDYTRLGETLRALVAECRKRKTELSLPSMRFGTLDKSLAEELAGFRKSGFTLAPEAGTDRLRRVINKVIDEEEMIGEVAALARMGWRQFKLYFIVGLPTETEEDLEAIVELSKRIKDAAGRRAKVTASASTFVPKPFTPFQWEPMLDVDEIGRRQKFLKKRLRGTGIKWKYHDARLTVAEGVLARGGRECGKLLLGLHGRGVKFSSWTDYFDEKAWEEEYANAGIDLAAALGRREVSEPLPWEHLDMRIDRRFLEAEREKAYLSRRAETTPDCRVGDCVDCGACDGEEIEVRLAENAPELPLRDAAEESAPETETPFRYRISFRKFGRIIYLGHLELKSVFEKALRRSKLPLRFTRGFHPQVRLVFSPPLPVGIASDAELADVFLNGQIGPEEILNRIRAEMPDGIEITGVSEVPLKSPALQRTIKAESYRVGIESTGIPAAELEEAAERFNSSERVPVMRKAGDAEPVNLKDFIREILVDGSEICFTVEVVGGAVIRPPLVLRSVFGFKDEMLEKVDIIKTGVDLGGC